MKETEVIFFVSDQRIGMIRPDGTCLSYPEFTAPTLQEAWQMEYVFPDGKQAVLLSREPPRNPKAAFDHPDGVGRARTHLWRYDFEGRTMREIMVPSQMRLVGLIPGQNRFLISGNTDNVTSLFTCDLDGDSRDDIFSGPGYAYGTSISPDGLNSAYHIVGVPGRPTYEIHVIDHVRKGCKVIAGDAEYLRFGPFWSPDGQWLLYQCCRSKQDPGHDRSDVCISRADGSEHRMLTSGQSHWFATSYGVPGKHGSGSNMPIWSPDGRVTCTLLLPDSRSAWPYAVGRPDTDHFNRDYRPESAHGGTRVCLIDPRTGKITPITNDDPPTWNFRLAWSPDGSRLAFIRAEVGRMSELWVMDADGKNRRMLTRGRNGTNIDHPRWVRIAVPAI